MCQMSECMKCGFLYDKFMCGYAINNGGQPCIRPRIMGGICPECRYNDGH